MDGREEVDRGIGAEEPLVAVVADQQLRGRVAEELEHEGAVHQAAAVVGLLGAHAQAKEDPVRRAQETAPETPWRRESSSRRNAATREAVVPGPKPAS